MLFYFSLTFMWVGIFQEACSYYKNLTWFFLRSSHIICKMANWGIVTILKQIELVLPCRPFFPITLAQICIKEFNEQKLLFIACSCLKVQTAYGCWIIRQPESLNALKGTLLFKSPHFQGFPQFQWNRPIKTSSETYSARVFWYIHFHRNGVTI